MDEEIEAIRNRLEELEIMEQALRQTSEILETLGIREVESDDAQTH